MTQDRTPQRTAAVDESWSPFATVHGTPSMDRTVDEGADADARPSTVRADAAGWRPRIIEGGRGRTDSIEQDAAGSDENTATAGDGTDADVLDAAAADALAIFDAPAAELASEAVNPGPAPATQPALPVEEAPAAPEVAPQAPARPAQEADSTPHTPHPEQATPETPAPAQTATEAAETPHSTPWLRTAVGWLNPYEVLDRPLPPVSEIYEAARLSVADRSGFDQITELAWVYAIGMPVTVACYTLAAAVQRKWRGVGTATVVSLWVAAAETAPVDASLIWFWTAVGYWVSTALILPAVIKAKQ